MAAAFDPIGLITVLAQHHVDYVLVGGMGAVLHGSPTTTVDADIVPSKDADNLARLAGALSDLDARVRSTDEPDGIRFTAHADLLAGVATLNLTTRCGDLDLTFTPSGLPDYARLSADSVGFDVDGIIVRVAALDDIIHSKRVADRPKDRAMLPILEALREEILAAEHREHP